MLSAILASIVFLAVVVWAIITRQKIIDWFCSRHRIKRPNEIAFTLNTRLRVGDYEVVQGIFDEHTQSVTDGHVIHGEKIESFIASGNELKIYE